MAVVVVAWRGIFRWLRTKWVSGLYQHALREAFCWFFQQLRGFYKAPVGGSRFAAVVVAVAVVVVLEALVILI